jgi:flagellin-like hook-associated protein FlgL
MQREANALTAEWNRIVATTSFNGRMVFDTSQTATTLQVGQSSVDNLSVTLGGQLARTVGTGTYTASSTLPSAPGTIFWRTAADYNGDGNTDQIYYSLSTSRMHVALGNGNGTFKGGTSYYVGNSDSNYVNSAESIDINGDGALDILTTTSTDNAIAILFGNGNGTFKAPVSYGPITSNGLYLMDARYGDINGDGYGDIVTSGSGGQVDLRFLLGNGNGTFKAAASQVINAGLMDIDLADVNGDGILDVIGGDQTSALNIMLGNGNATFKLMTQTLGPTNTWSGKVADFNNDGFMDVVVSDYSYPTPGAQIYIGLGNGNGTFKTGAGYNLYSAFALQLADLNNDGLVDIAGRSASGGMQVAISNGDGTFKAFVSTSVASPWTTIFADFNNDGVLDMSADASSGSV